MTEPGKRRMLPDKYIAAAIFVLLLGVYLWTKDEVVKGLVIGAWTLLVNFLNQGLSRMAESFKAKLSAETGHNITEKGASRKQTTRSATQAPHIEIGD